MSSARADKDLLKMGFSRGGFGSLRRTLGFRAQMESEPQRLEAGLLISELARVELVPFPVHLACASNSTFKFTLPPLAFNFRSQLL